MTATTTERRRLADPQVIPTLAIAGLTSATAVSLCRVFADWSYLRPMLVVVIGTHLAAMLFRVVRVHVVLSLPLMLGAVLELLALVYHRDTMLHGLLPGSDSIAALRADLREVVMQFPTAIAPVASDSSWPRAAAAVLGVCAAMADTFAFRANGRAETVAPCAVVFVFIGALGIDAHRVTVAAMWIAAALLVVAVLRFRTSSAETAWMGARRLSMTAALPTMLALVAVAGVAALAVGPRLPGAGAAPLYDTRHQSGGVTEIVSPIVDIGGDLRDRGNQELFTVRSLDGGHYWRLTGLPVFNGQTWELGDEDLEPMGDRAAEISADGATGQQLITIKAMGGHLVPSAYRPVRVSPDQVVWAPMSQSLVLPDTDLKRGDTIAIDAEVINPSTDQLRLASVTGTDPSFLALPDGIPDTVRATALQVTAGAPTSYDMAMALQTWFRTEFEYDVDVDFGNDSNAMVEFLDARRGFCQQFAGTFAVMARSLGLPTRVAVGFTPGEVDSEGLWHVYGRHAHAWPEVWFDGLGWIAFEPTPGRGNGDATGYTGIPAEQAAPTGGGGETG
ncbi:MAG TPA: transglutaminaseTgpA domain-containing protein, partial [Ilumatobacteraceae bacterium]|nr:transglutaminaseTgpA domain-containing protein [Ilumatobacteraceae bacterium]